MQSIQKQLKQRQTQQSTSKQYVLQRNKIYDTLKLKQQNV